MLAYTYRHRNAAGELEGGHAALKTARVGKAREKNDGSGWLEQTGREDAWRDGLLMTTARARHSLAATVWCALLVQPPGIAGTIPSYVQ